MSYQTSEHAIGTTQNLESILLNINNNSKLVVDIGANQCVLSNALALDGFNVKARIQTGKPRILDLNKISELPTVKFGAIKESEILAFYEPYFTNNYFEFSHNLK